MYLKEYFPFYTTYANPLLYEGERMQDKEFNLMKSYYPGTVQHIQEKIERNVISWIMREAAFMMNIRINI